MDCEYDNETDKAPSCIIDFIISKGMTNNFDSPQNSSLASDPWTFDEQPT